MLEAIESPRQLPCAEPGDVSAHYLSMNSVAYEKAWFYNDGTPYQHWLVEQVRAQGIAASADDRLLDIGCGTGNFTRLLRQAGGLRHDVVGVDPFLEPSVGDGMHRVKANAEDYVEGMAGGLEMPAQPGVPTAFNSVLMKEMVHHVDAEFGDICRGLRVHFATQLAAGAASSCSVVIVTRPRAPLDHYPFFAAAKRAWQDGVPADEAQLTARLRSAGFAGRNGTVTATHSAFPVEMPLGQWKAMVKGRFWSTLHGFSDAELAEELEAMDKNGEFDRFFVPEAGGSGDDRVIRFEDKLIFIKAALHQ